jgi:hypothetical protein
MHSAIRRAVEFANAQLDRRIGEKLAELHSHEHELRGEGR